MIYFNEEKYELILNKENYDLVEKETKNMKISHFTDLIQIGEDEWLYIKDMGESEKMFFHEKNGINLFQKDKCLTQIEIIYDNMIYLRNNEGKTLYNIKTNQSFSLNINFGVEVLTILNQKYLEIEIPEEEDSVLIGLNYQNFEILYIYSNRFQREIASKEQIECLEEKEMENLIRYYLNIILPTTLEQAQRNKNNMILKKLMKE